MLKVSLQVSCIRKEKAKQRRKFALFSLKTQNYLKPGTGLTTQDMKQIYLIRARNLFLKTNFPGMFSDNKCVNINCDQKDTQFHLFYSDCFKSENKIIEKNLEYNQIFSNDVTRQKIIKEIIMQRYQIRSNILSSMGRSRWSGDNLQDQRMKFTLLYYNCYIFIDILTHFILNEINIT